MKHNYKEGIVYLTFINKKGMKKTVKFPMRKSYYDDICKLTETEQFKWLLDNYKYYNAEKYQEKKHTQHRDKFISADFNYDNEDEINNITQKKMQALSYDPQYEKKLIIKKTCDAILLDFSPRDRYIIEQTIMHDVPNTKVAEQLKINESTVRYVIKKFNKNKEKYKFYAEFI